LMAICPMRERTELSSVLMTKRLLGGRLASATLLDGWRYSSTRK
jgi:hypothetical protein